MATEESNWIEELRGSRIQSVTDDGAVVLLHPDGQQRIVTVPRESVPIVRRLAEMDREIDREARRIAGWTPRGAVLR